MLQLRPKHASRTLHPTTTWYHADQNCHIIDRPHLIALHTQMIYWFWRCFMYSSNEGAAEIDLRGSSASSKDSGSRVSAIPPAPLYIRKSNNKIELVISIAVQLIGKYQIETWLTSELENDVIQFDADSELTSPGPRQFPGWKQAVGRKQQQRQ